MYQDGPIIPWKYVLLICSIALDLDLFLEVCSIFSFDIVKLGVYKLCKVASCKSIIIYPVVFLVIKWCSSKNFIPSLIVFKGIFNFLDKSVNFISLPYLDKNLLFLSFLLSHSYY